MDIVNKNEMGAALSNSPYLYQLPVAACDHRFTGYVAHAGETTTVGEPRPGPYGRHAAFSLAEHEAASTGASGSSKKGDKEEPELSLFSLYNNPLGYLLLGMAVFGIISQNMPKWS